MVTATKYDPDYVSPYSGIEEEEVGDVPKSPSTYVSPYFGGREKGPVYNEETFHADSQSIADSRMLASKFIKAPQRQSETQGQHIAAEMAQGMPARSLESIRSTLSAEKDSEAAYQAQHIQSLSDGDFTRESLDWLGTTRWNMVKTGELAFSVGGWSDEEQQALVRLMANYEELPTSWKTTGRAAAGLASDPTTYIGLSFVLNALSKIVLKPIAGALVRSLMKTTAGAGTVGAVEVGGYMGVDNLLNQKIDVETGQRDDYNYLETAAYTAAGAAGGYLIIGGLTALTLRGASKGLSKNANEAVDEVVEEATPVTDEVVELSDESIDEVVEAAPKQVDETIDLVDDLETVSDDDYMAEMLNELGDDIPEDDLAFLSRNIEDDYAQELASASAKGADDSSEYVVEELKPTTVMPKGLAGAKPRYNYGQDSYNVKFESDVDKALYIVAGKGKSKSHEEYMRFLRGVFPDKSVEEIKEMGTTVKAKIKDSAKNKDVDLDGDLSVNATYEPTKKPRRPKGESKALDEKPKIYDEAKPAKMPYNINRMRTAQDTKNLVLERAEQHRKLNPLEAKTMAEVIEEGRAAAKDMAEKTGANFDEVMKLVKGDVVEMAAIVNRIKATRDLHVWTYDKLKELAYKHKDDGGLSALEKAELVKVVQMINQLVPVTIDQSVGASRVLGSRRAMAISDDSLIRGHMDVDADVVKGKDATEAIAESEAEVLLPLLDQNAVEAIENGNGPFVIDALVDSIIAGIESGKIKDPRSAAKELAPSRLARIIAEINRIRAGSMLGGLTTMTMAAVSNHFHMIWEPALEYASRHNFGLTKASRASQVEDKLARARALAQYSGNMQYYLQGWKEAMRAVKLGVHLTDPNVTHMESNANALGNKFKSKKRIIYENITGYAHTILMALDEQHKFTRAHSLAFADAVVEVKRLELNAAKEGKVAFKEGSAEAEVFIQKHIASMFDEHGAVKQIDETNTPAGRKAAAQGEAIMREIRMETFTEELVGDVGRLVNGIAGSGGGLGALVLPFRRAPVNSISYALQYAPIPESIFGIPVMRFISAKQDAILKSGDKVQIAKLRMRKKVGAMAGAYLWFKSDTGELTGGGPSDYKAQAAWIAAGNKPYSVKIAGEWVPYAKIEPFSTVMGVMANAHYIWKMDPERFQDGTAHVVEAVQVALVQSILNKAYFSSINDWMKLLAGENNKLITTGHSVVTSFVPNALSQMNSDPNVREATELLEKVQRKIDGWSQELGMQYDITGQPKLKPNDGWNLFKQPNVRADTSNMAKTVMTEIYDLRVVQDKDGLLGEPPRNLNAGRKDYREVYDRNETESVYAKYNRFIGEEVIRGKTLEEALYDKINSNQYQTKPKSPYLDVDSPHINMLSEIIKKYRKKAKKRLLDESDAFRELYDVLEDKKREVKLAR
tara:strand:- start:1525 stop:5763 length:4239 start_codon:yes stop_codon:yes gene_type:complete